MSFTSLGTLFPTHAKYLDHSTPQECIDHMKKDGGLEAVLSFFELGNTTVLPQMKVEDPQRAQIIDFERHVCKFLAIEADKMSGANPFKDRVVGYAREFVQNERIQNLHVTLLQTKAEGQATTLRLTQEITQNKTRIEQLGKELQDALKREQELRNQPQNNSSSVGSFALLAGSALAGFVGGRLVDGPQAQAEAPKEELERVRAENEKLKQDIQSAKAAEEIARKAREDADRASQEELQKKNKEVQEKSKEMDALKVSKEKEIDTTRRYAQYLRDELDKVQQRGANPPQALGLGGQEKDADAPREDDFYFSFEERNNNGNGNNNAANANNSDRRTILYMAPAPTSKWDYTPVRAEGVIAGERMTTEELEKVLSITESTEHVLRFNQLALCNYQRVGEYAANFAAWCRGGRKDRFKDYPPLAQLRIYEHEQFPGEQKWKDEIIQIIRDNVNERGGDEKKAFLDYLTKFRKNPNVGAKYEALLKAFNP